ncbi:MAG: hypothetical protein AAFQ14_17495 [Cyanobacteria bacterium J06621_12]
MSQYPAATIPIDEFLDRLMDVTNDLEKYLFAWQHHSSKNSSIHLSEFINLEVSSNKLSSEIIHPSLKNTAKFSNWLMQEEIVTKLEQSLTNDFDEDYTDCIAAAINILRSAKEKQANISNSSTS